MMTDVMLGDSPDGFQAGAAFMGVPFGCFAGPGVDVWNAPCAEGQVTMTPQEWGNLARAADPGYTGPRPRAPLCPTPPAPPLTYVNSRQKINPCTTALALH